MPKTTPTAILVLALSFCAQANAAKWVGVSGKDAASGAVEVDTASIHSTGDGKSRIWHREQYAKAKIADSGAYSFTRLTTLSEFSCDKRLAAAIQRSYTAADGSELKSESLDGRDPRPIAPESTLEAVFGYACKGRTRPAVARPAATPVAVPAAAAAPPAPLAQSQPAQAPVKESAPPSRKAKNGKEPAPPPPPVWSYRGNTGPDKWGSLGTEYAACSIGQRQSPIDVRGTLRADLPPITFAYQPVALAISDDGNGIRVDTANAGGIVVDGLAYELQYLRFHRPGEGKINGKAYDMSAHLVHKAKSGQIAVVAVMLEAGKEHGLLRTLWTHLPLEQHTPTARSDVKIDLLRILPARLSYYAFTGSLSAPPCTEGVLWLVLKTPVQVSREQLAGFATIYRNNARPVQLVNGRLIKESR